MKAARAIGARVRPAAGQKWADRDPRMNNTAVVITRVDHDAGRVYYRRSSSQVVSSNLERFQQAFRFLPPVVTTEKKPLDLDD